jgi:hypothetical protein
MRSEYRACAVGKRHPYARSPPCEPTAALHALAPAVQLPADHRFQQQVPPGAPLWTHGAPVAIDTSRLQWKTGRSKIYIVAPSFVREQGSALTRALEVKHGGAVPAVNGDGQPDGGAVVQLVLRAHAAHLLQPLHRPAAPQRPSASPRAAPGRSQHVGGGNGDQTCECGPCNWASAGVPAWGGAMAPTPGAPPAMHVSGDGPQGSARCHPWHIWYKNLIL